MKLSYKHEKLYQYMCLSGSYLILYLAGQYVDIVKNNETHVSIVTMHVSRGVVQTVFPCLCQILFDKYHAHAESWSSICLRYTIFRFTIPYFLIIVALVFECLR